MLASFIQGIVQSGVDQAQLAIIAAAIAAVLGMLLGLALGKRPDLRDEAQLVANYTEALEAVIKKVAVVAAEAFGNATGKKGIEKLIFALDLVEAAFAAVGIKGDPNQVKWGEVIADLKKIAGELFPPKKPEADKAA